MIPGHDRASTVHQMTASDDAMVATSRGVPDLPAQLCRARRPGATSDRCRHAAWHHRPPRPPGVAGGGRAVGVALLPLPDGRLRLRRQRLLRHRPDLRHPRRSRRTGRRGTPPRPAGDARLGAQPHERRAPVVRREPSRSHQPQGRLVRVARRSRPPTGTPRSRRATPPGSSTSRAGSTTCATSPCTSPTSSGTRPRSRRRCTTRCGSGSTGASTGSGWTSST